MPEEFIPFDRETVATAFDEVDTQAALHPALDTIAATLRNSNNSNLHGVAERLVTLHPNTASEEDWGHAKNILHSIAAEMDPEYFT